MSLSGIVTLERAAIEPLLRMPDACVAVKSAFKAISSRNAVVPPRINLPLDDQSANSLVMPVYVSGYPFYIVKIVSLNPRNAKLDQPLIHSVIQVFCSQTGRLLALLDGEYITGLRTGAGSAVATDLLASDSADTLAIFGSGPQAWFQVMGVLEVRAIKRVMVFGRDPAKTKAFSNRLSDHFRVKAWPETNLGKLRDAQVICTATTSQSPLFRSSDVSPGTHINAVGAYKPDMAEIAATVLQDSLVVVDSRETALREAGDLVRAIQDGIVSKPHCGTEIGELLLHNEIPQRRMSVFKSVGNAAQDFYCVAVLWPKIATG
ncbi:MAG: ornithine cyclodeaminase [Fimbriimonadaceae bacterium]